MKRKRRWLSAILAIAVLLAFAPMGALATEESSSQEAVEWNADEENQSEETTAVVEQNDNKEENADTISNEDADLDVTAEDTVANDNESEKDSAGDAAEDADAENNASKNEDLSEAEDAAAEPMVLLRASGDGDPKAVDVSITNFEIQNLAHQTADSVYYNDTFYLAMDWDASGLGATVREGDYFDITLPENMSFPSGTTARDFNLTDDNGNIIATAHVTPGDGDVGGTIHVTFTDAAENKYNLKGTMYLAARFDRTQITTGETNTFSISVNGEVTGSPIETGVVVVGPKELQDEYLAKWGQSVDNEPNIAEWVARINYTKASLHNVVITDTMGDSGETYIRDSFRLRLVEYDNYGHTLSSQDVDLSDKLTISEDGKSFTIRLGDIDGQQYRLMYRTTYTPGTTLRNALTLNSTETNKTYKATHISADSGGTGGGDLASKIKLIKVDENDETIVLAGAVFEVTAPDGSTFELTTGSDGTVTSGLLTQGAYKVKEISAPAGYELNDEEFTLNVSPTGGAIRTVTNRMITTTISGSKTWDDNDNQDGARPESITIRLLANGTEVDSKNVTEADDWSWSFSELPKFESGEEIVYTVTEDAISGYSATYDGFNVTNTHAPGKTSVTVTKKWEDSDDKDGIRPASITVNLFADGVDTGATLEISASDNWEGSFTDLDEFKNGEKIKYTVEEKEVTGYEGSVSGDAEAGFVITNIHEPKTPAAPSNPDKPNKVTDKKAPGKTTASTSTRHPKTGDKEHMPLYLGILAVTMAVLIVSLVVRRRKEEV